MRDKKKNGVSISRGAYACLSLRDKNNNLSGKQLRKLLDFLANLFLLHSKDKFKEKTG